MLFSWGGLRYDFGNIFLLLVTSRLGTFYVVYFNHTRIIGSFRSRSPPPFLKFSKFLPKQYVQWKRDVSKKFNFLRNYLVYFYFFSNLKKWEFYLIFYFEKTIVFNSYFLKNSKTFLNFCNLKKRFCHFFNF